MSFPYFREYIVIELDIDRKVGFPIRAELCKRTGRASVPSIWIGERRNIKSFRYIQVHSELSKLVDIFADMLRFFVLKIMYIITNPTMIITSTNIATQDPCHIEKVNFS